MSGGGTLGTLLAPIVAALDARLEFEFAQLVRFSGLVVAQGDTAAPISEPSSAVLFVIAFSFSG